MRIFPHNLIINIYFASKRLFFLLYLVIAHFEDKNRLERKEGAKSVIIRPFASHNPYVAFCYIGVIHVFCHGPVFCVILPKVKNNPECKGKRILKRFKRIFQSWTNNYTKPQIKPLRRKENHVKHNPLPCVMFRKSFRHTKQTLKPHQA